MDLYLYLTNIIAIFYSLSDSGTAMGGYPNMVLIILLLTFFFNKKIACMSSISAFMANASNSIIKSTMCFSPYLNVSIFHSASAILLLSLNAILISNTAIILLSITITLLLLGNNHISLHQSSNFIWSPSNYPRSRTMLFGITICTVSLYTASVGAVNISSGAGFVVLFLFKA